MGFYESLRDNTAAPLIKKYGQQILLRPPVIASIDPVTSTITPGATVDYTGYAIEEEYAQRDVDGTNIKRGDKKLLIAVDITIPPITPDFKVIMASTVWHVIDCKPTSPGGITIVYTAQIRK